VDLYQRPKPDRRAAPQGCSPGVRGSRVHVQRGAGLRAQAFRQGIIAKGKRQNVELKLCPAAFCILYSLEVAMTTVTAPTDRVLAVPSPQEITGPALEGKKERKRKHTSQVGKGLGKRKKTVSKKKPPKEKTSRKRRRTSCIPKRKPTKKKTKTKIGRTTKRKACKK